MAKTFVAVNDRVQGILRECTRNALLRAGGAGGVIQHEVRPEKLPAAYYPLAAFHSVQGFSVDETILTRWRVQEEQKPLVAIAAGYLDATRVDRRCAGDLRLRPAVCGPGLMAAEVLTFGTGALRPAGYAATAVWEFMEYGRLSTRFEVVHARIAALHCGPWSSGACIEKEVYYSSNLMYGDVLGELEQLWERRADTDFLDQVARHLRCMRFWSRRTAPAHAPLDYEAVIKTHLRAQAVWRKPPTTGRALLRRIEFILTHTMIDSSPVTTFPTPAHRPNPLSRPDLDLGQDRSGYDGWLTDPSPGLD